MSNHGATKRGTAEFFRGEGFRLSEDLPDVTRAHFVDLQDGERRLESFSDMVRRLISHEVSQDQANLALQTYSSGAAACEISLETQAGDSRCQSKYRMKHGRNEGRFPFWSRTFHENLAHEPDKVWCECFASHECYACTQAGCLVFT